MIGGGDGVCLLSGQSSGFSSGKSLSLYSLAVAIRDFALTDCAVQSQSDIRF